MSKPAKTPTTLVEAIQYFSDPDTCVEFVASLRWPDGPVCPRCDGREHSYLKTRRIWKCKGCKKQFSVKVGTIFEDSALGLDKWLPAIWLAANSKNGISSHELGRALGVTQKSAWFMLHRIRLALQMQSLDNCAGEVEVDEGLIGGKARNLRRHIREQRRSSTEGKTFVMGALERGGNVRVQIVGDIRRPTLHAAVQDHVAKGATVYTDKLRSYRGIQALGYQHEVVDHAQTYVDGKVHVNGLENFWALLKRGLGGTYVSVQPFHLFRYLDERVFTFNHRGLDDLGRFVSALSGMTGRRLTYRELTGKA